MDYVGLPLFPSHFVSLQTNLFCTLKSSQISFVAGVVLLWLCGIWADLHAPARRLEFGVPTQDWYWAVELSLGCFRLSFLDSFSLHAITGKSY
jgi:hypothetical protein